MKTIQREKITERVWFSEEEKDKILSKTGQKCAHCGKPIFVMNVGENKMTVDHFIPLYKGGTNRMINLVPLCYDCNEEKADKIVNPKEYLPFIKKQYLDEIAGYYDSYIHSFHYFTENNIFADDEFIIKVPMFPLKGVRDTSGPITKLKYTVKKAAYCDLDRIYAFYLSYIDKYAGEEKKRIKADAEQTIISWFEKGCIYYIEKNGNIVLMTAFELTDVKSETGYKGPAFRLHPFSLYNNPRYGELLTRVVFYFPKKIMRERGSRAVPVLLSVMSNDMIYMHLSWIYDFISKMKSRGEYSEILTIFTDDPYGIAIAPYRTLTTEEKEDMKTLMEDFMTDDDIPERGNVS